MVLTCSVYCFWVREQPELMCRSPFWKSIESLWYLSLLISKGDPLHLWHCHIVWYLKSWSHSWQTEGVQEANIWENNDNLVGGFNSFENISQNGNLPQVGMKIKHIWNHHLVSTWDSLITFSVSSGRKKTLLSINKTRSPVRGKLA